MAIAYPSSCCTAASILEPPICIVLMDGWVGLTSSQNAGIAFMCPIDLHTASLLALKTLLTWEP